MRCLGDQTLVPQKEEHITAIKWITMKDIEEPLENTYASIREIVERFRESKE
jgi:hypothetical protein